MAWCNRYFISFLIVIVADSVGCRIFPILFDLAIERIGSNGSGNNFLNKM
ncbi:hypothetical protein MXB_4005, partial [Myxobolus squamalis]